MTREGQWPTWDHTSFIFVSLSLGLCHRHYRIAWQSQCPATCGRVRQEQMGELGVLEELPIISDLETRNTSTRNVASKAVTRNSKDSSHPVPTQTQSSWTPAVSGHSPWKATPREQVVKKINKTTEEVGEGDIEKERPNRKQWFQSLREHLSEELSFKHERIKPKSKRAFPDPSRKSDQFSRLT